MGRHGPLTSLALGRSPYDEVVQGSGDNDPRAPHQEYDERGRPLNPNTKRINKDIIRSHNEVMLVIGVAEPENAASDPQLESNRRHDAHEEDAARYLRPAAELLESSCAWGVNGLRHRILLYKRYSDVPFHQLFLYHRTQQLVGSYFLSGLPAYIANHGFRVAAYNVPILRRERWLRYICLYGIMHMDLYSMMQRAGLIASAAWFPSWEFFVPGSAMSPIALPSLPSTLTTGTILQWLGGLAIGVAPFAGFYLRQIMYAYIYKQVWRGVIDMIPAPLNHDKSSLVAQANICPDCGIPSATPSSACRSETNWHHSHQDQRHQNSQRRNDVTNPGTPVRSQNGIATARDDDFGSDDDENEVCPTLISFDVEATEQMETPPGWCAELRPNVEQGSMVANQEPRYRTNGLTILPAYLAADTLSSLVPRLITEPLQALIWCALSRSMLARQGLPLDEIREIGVFSWGAWKNLLGMNLVHFVLQGEAWFSIYAAVKFYTLTPEEWEKLQGGGSVKQ